MGTTISASEMSTGDAPKLVDDSRVPRRWEAAWRWGWVVLAVLATAIFASSLPATYTILNTVCMTGTCSAQLSQALAQDLLSRNLSVRFYANLCLALIIFSAAIYMGVAILIYSRKSRRWSGLLGSLALALFGLIVLSSNPTAMASLPVPLNWIGRVLDYLGMTSLILFLYIFPDGRFSPRWTAALVILAAVLLVPEYFLPGAPSVFRSWGWDQTSPLQYIEWLVILAPLIWAQVYRYRRVYSLAQRLQVKWVVYGLTIAVCGFLLISLVPVLFPGLLENTWGHMASLIVIYLLMDLLPIVIGIAILRHGLWDIDLLINRTMVYIPLTGILGGLYSSSITLFQRIFISTTGQKSDAAIVITTLILASAFTPIKNGLQGAIDNRFKEPNARYRELKRLEHQVQSVVEVLTVQNLTRRLLEAAVRAFQAKGGAVYMEESGEIRLVHASDGWNEGQEQISLPIACGGQPLAVLKLGERDKALPYGSEEREILGEVCEQIAQALQLAGRG